MMGIMKIMGSLLAGGAQAGQSCPGQGVRKKHSSRPQPDPHPGPGNDPDARQLKVEIHQNTVPMTFKVIPLKPVDVYYLISQILNLHLHSQLFSW